MSEITISVGTELHVVLGAPATYDEAGFAALSYTEVGEVGTIPTFGGQSQVSEFIPIKTGIVDKRVGSTNYGSSNLTIGNVFSDAGQVALKSAFDGANRGKVHSIKLVNAEIGTIYFTAVVTSYQINIGDANTITTCEVTLELTNKLIIDADAFVVTYAAVGNGSIIGEAVQMVQSGGATQKVYAAPNAGKTFVQWNDLSVENPRDDAGVVANVTYTASFSA